MTTTTTYKTRRTYRCPSVGGGPECIVKIVGWEDWNGSRWAIVRHLETDTLRWSMLQGRAKDSAGRLWGGKMLCHPDRMAEEVTL